MIKGICNKIDSNIFFLEIINNLMKQIEQMNSGLKELKKDALNTSIPNKLILNKTNTIYPNDGKDFNIYDKNYILSQIH